MITFVVDGIPRPKGSMKAFVRGNRAIITADNKKTAPWAAVVTATAKRFAPPLPYDEPCRVRLEFRLPRLKSHRLATGNLKASAPFWQSTKPDIDKLARTVLDALTKAGFWTDDSRVSSLIVNKSYLDVPGLGVFVETMSGQTGPL